jgi:hypothetical protein
MLDGENLVLNIDGSVNRRLGMNFENNYVEISTAISDINGITTTTFRWQNAGGNSTKNILVVQIANELLFFDEDYIPLSSGHLSSYTASGTPTDTAFSFAVVDGILVIATGQKSPLVFTYNINGTITSSTTTLKVRDLFGLEDIWNGNDLYTEGGVQIRPTSVTNAHIYNLRNQSWGIFRTAAQSLNGSPAPGTTADPITIFSEYDNGFFPSNADSVTQALYPNVTNTSDPVTDTFWPGDLAKNPSGTFPTANGYFIIDALARGPSRNSVCTTNNNLFKLNFAVSTLPTDTTPGGPSTVCEYAGRMWYGGFSGEVIGGDSRSPHLSSYLLFSQLVDNFTTIPKCYQEADPTNKNNPDLVDTDGGFIRVNEAYGICRMVNLGDSLFIFAANGVWRIYGGTVKGFTATAYVVEKITDRGTTNPESVVTVQNTVMYWSDDAIYHIRSDQYGSWEAANISIGHIQNLVNSIGPTQRVAVKGAYDNFENRVRWLYQNNVDYTGNTMELVYDTRLQAFYRNSIQLPTGLNYPKPTSMYITNPYPLVIEPEEIYVGTTQVFVSTNDVQVGIETVTNEAKKELGYLVITAVSPVVKFSFAQYNQTGWRDWYSLDNVGIDAAAYALTTSIPQDYMSSTFQPKNDFQRKKQVPYITTYMDATETGFTEVSAGVYTPVGGSSGIMQAMWEWTNSANSGKWSRPMQIYNHGRVWNSLSLTQGVTDGYAVVISKSKIRGIGRVISLKFSTEPNLDFHLYGWSLMMSENQAV